MATIELHQEGSKKETGNAAEIALVLTQALESGGDVLKELLRTSAASPIIAAATVIILSDILASKGVISKDASGNLNQFIVLITGLKEVGGILSTGVQTLVYAETGGLSEAGIGALLGKAQKK